MTKWKQGDYCLAWWQEDYRPFQIVSIVRNTHAYLHATSKRDGERITVRTVRRLDTLKPLPKDQRSKKMMIVHVVTLAIPCLALAGLIYLVCKPESPKDDH